MSRGSEKAIWERFRAACDQFFSRRHDDLKKRKDEWSENLARKEALCAEAEALATSTDWDAAAAQCKKLQAEWKQIGPVRRSKSEAVWQRFRAACDVFFDRYKHRDQVELQSKAAARADVIRGAGGAWVPRADWAARVAARRKGSSTRCRRPARAWQQAPELPRTAAAGTGRELPPGARHDLVARVAGRVRRHRSRSRINTRKRMEKLLARVEALASQARRRGPRPPASPAELLAQRWRERLAANTMAGGQAVAQTEELAWREAEQEVRSAQSQWTRLGPVPADVAGPLNERFQRACRKFYDQRRK